MGGAPRVLYEQSREFSARGHEVQILTREEQFRKGYGGIEGVREWKYPVIVRNPFLFLKTSVLNGKKVFEYICKEHPIDVLSFRQPVSALAILRSPKSNEIRKCYTCHSLSFEEFQSRNPCPKGLIKRIGYQVNVLIRKYVEKTALIKSDIILADSQFTEEKLLRTYGISPEKIRVIPLGVDLRRFSPATDRMEIRQRLGIPQDRFILLSVRNLVPRMGLDRLIMAISKVVKSAPDVHLVLGGEGPLKEALLALAKRFGLEDFIEFTGFIPEDDLPDYYRIADFFVLPTRELEGFGLVTLEAMASGVPVLGTPVGGTREILSKFDAKLLFKDTGPDSMAQLIIKNCCKIRGNPHLWEELSDQCRCFVENNYSWERNVDSMEKVFLNGLME